MAIRLFLKNSGWPSFYVPAFHGWFRRIVRRLTVELFVPRLLLR